MLNELFVELELIWSIVIDKGKFSPVTSCINEFQDAFKISWSAEIYLGYQIGTAPFSFDILIIYQAGVDEYGR